MTSQPTEKQRRFFAEYQVDQNGTQAAIRAGYSERSAAVTASRLLRLAKTDAKVAEIQANTRAAVVKKAAKSAGVAAAENTAAYAITKTLALIEYGTELTPVLGMFGPIVIDGETLMEMRDPRVATANIATLIKQFPEFSDKHEIEAKVGVMLVRGTRALKQ